MIQMVGKFVGGSILAKPYLAIIVNIFMFVFHVQLLGSIGQMDLSVS